MRRRSGHRCRGRRTQKTVEDSGSYGDASRMPRDSLVFAALAMSRLRKLLLLAIPLALMITGLTADELDGDDAHASIADRHASIVPTTAVVGDAPPLRVLTYNLHSGLGPYLRLHAPRAEVERNLRRIARHIADAAPPAAPVDVIGLNEVDFASRRSGWLDQAMFLARELERLTGYAYQVARAETWNRTLWGMEVRYGNAALVRHPVRAVSIRLLEQKGGVGPAGGPLTVAPAPSPSRFFGTEPRGALRVSVDFHGRELDLLVTHLDAFDRARRERQATEVVRDLVRPGRTTILVGDINTASSTVGGRVQNGSDRTHDLLAGALLDARLVLAARTGLGDLSSWATYPAITPRLALDAVLASPDLWPVVSRVVGRYESDHRGLLVQYSWLTRQASEAHGLWYAALRQQ